MKIHGITLVKDEADIIEQMLLHAVRWCDFIYVFDNGSTDGTWEIVRRLATQHRAIIPFSQDDRVFTDEIRAEVYTAFRDRSASGDWWCRLDADEIYIDHPYVFLSKVPRKYRTVMSASFQYFFTDEDVRQYIIKPERYSAKIPIENRIRYYMNNYSEKRFVRDDGGLNWKGAWPQTSGSAFPVKIWLKHYQYRSPDQIQKRLDLRLALARTTGNFGHEALTDWLAQIQNTGLAGNPAARIAFNGSVSLPRWEDRVVPAELLDFDQNDGRYVLRENLMRPIPQPTIWRRVYAALSFSAPRR